MTDNLEGRMPDLQQVRACADAILAIGDPTNYKIIEYILKENKAAFGEIKRELNIKYNNELQYHLKILKSNNLVAQKYARGPYFIPAESKNFIDRIAQISRNLADKFPEKSESFIKT